MKNTEIIHQFLLDYELKFAKSTVKNYGIMLHQFFNYCPQKYNAVKKEDIRKWLGELNTLGRTPGTIQNKLFALKSFYRYCREENLIEKDPTVNIIAPKRPDRLPVYLHREQIIKLKESARGNLRNLAIIETLYSTGVRVSELQNIRLEDINWNNRQIIISEGKGKKERLVLFTSECAERLKEYLNTRKDKNPYLFISRKGGGPLTAYGYAQILWHYANKLDLRLSPHILRHTFAAHLAEKGMPLVYIQVLLGHDDIKHTKIYTRLYSHARKKQYDKYQ